jgi:hypothetical protein
MLRGGALAGALVLQAGLHNFDGLELRVQGRHGVLPNLDVVSLARSLAGVPLSLPGAPAGAGFAQSTEQWKDSLLAAAAFLGRQARGEADGCVLVAPARLCADPRRRPRVHGAFLDAFVECASLSAVVDRGASETRARPPAALALGSLLESTVRSWSSASERLHHSSSFFILLSPGRLLSPPAYAPQLLAIALAPLLRASAAALRGDSGAEPPSPSDWAHALAVAAGVLSVCAGGYAALSLLPRDEHDARLLPQLAGVSLVALGAALSLHLPALALADGRRLCDGPWLALRSLVQLAITLCTIRVGVTNFSLALLFALLLVPASLLVTQPTATQQRLATLARMLAVLAASPFVAATGLTRLFGCSPALLLHRLTSQARRTEDSLLLQLLFGVYLPCWLLCALILVVGAAGKGTRADDTEDAKKDD